jgi:hypothetical protein
MPRPKQKQKTIKDLEKEIKSLRANIFLLSVLFFILVIAFSFWMSRFDAHILCMPEVNIIPNIDGGQSITQPNLVCHLYWIVKGV